MKKLLKILGIAALIIAVVIIAGLIYFNAKYPDVSPPSNIKVVSTAEKIDRGEYLANHVTVCIDCHSTRDWTKFSGPLIPGTEGKGGFNFGPAEGLPGNVYAKNITPAAIDEWTDGELIRAITQGVNKNNKALFPIMPYYSFNHLTESDLEAIVCYIKSLEPIENKVPETELNFPMNLIVKTIPIKTYMPSNPINRADSVEYGRYLATIASCGGCHTPAEKGEPIPGMNFAGGMEFKTPWGFVRSANITPDAETGIGNWTKDKFITTFKKYSTENAKNIHVDPNSFNSVMPWTMYGGMAGEDLAAIYDYLKTVKPVKHLVVKYTPLTAEK
jgi:mono/diheme cytochrome c family protein